MAAAAAVVMAVAAAVVMAVAAEVVMVIAMVMVIGEDDVCGMSQHGYGIVSS